MVLAFDYRMARKCTRCYHCGCESVENTFKYYNNGQRTQPRYQCVQCHNLFTLGSHGRRQGRSYAKKRNVDPPELKDLPRQCRGCGVADNAPFKYYNNKNFSQPRFKCLSCGLQFQMHLRGTGEERCLVHPTASYRRPARSNVKLGAAPNSGDGASKSRDGASNSDRDEICAQKSVADPWMPALEKETGKDFPSLSVEDARYLDFIECGLNGLNESPPPEVVLRLQLWASKLQLWASELPRRDR